MAFFKNSAEPASNGAATHMTFRVGGQLYGIPIDMVSEVVPAAGLAPLKDWDDAVVGQLELRGAALIVLDMGLRLTGRAVETTSNCCILIVRRENARSGCLFGEPGALIHVPEDKAELSGCLVDRAEAALCIPQRLQITPENTSLSSAVHGFPLYRCGAETILLPPRELCFPR